MRAIVQDEFGGPEMLHLADLPTPKLGPDAVLVRVAAAGVNPVDYKMREGGLESRFDHHFPLTPGWDLAGWVEDVGPAVRGFAPGDEVYGYVRMDVVQHGTYAELVAVPERTLAPPPRTVSLLHAAALPLAGLTAWQTVVEALDVQFGETVLVHAAAGGVGQFAVQVARSRGARVIGTASERNHDHLRSLHAEPVAYGEGLAERVRLLAPDGVDAVVDLVGGETLRASPALLHPARRHRIVSVTEPATVRELGGTYVFVRPDATQLRTLAQLVDVGEIALDVARVFPLDEAAAAQQLLAERHVRGKVVLRVGEVAG